MQKGEKMDDLISRQAAIDAVKRNTFRLTFAKEQNCEGHVAWSAYAVYADAMEGALYELPSAQPEQPSLQKFVEYQIEWLTSHDDIELEPVLEGWIVRFLKDTVECYEAERRD